MKPDLLEKLKDHFDEYTYSVLCDDRSSIRKRESKKTNALRLHDKISECENPKLKMYDAIAEAEASQTKNNLITAAKAAAQLDDFVTALYWHNKADLAPIDVDERFYRLKLYFLASAQKKQDPAAQPITSAKQMLHDTALAKKLEDKAYLDLETECKLLENEYYHKAFDAIAESVLAPRQEEFEKKEKSAVGRTGFVWIASIIWLIWSTPKVWVWAHDCFDRLHPLLLAVFWLVPIAYVIVSLVIVFILGEAAAGTKSDKLSASLTETIADQTRKIKKELSGTAPYQKREEMDSGIAAEYCNYDSRLLLALASRIYEEESLERVMKLPQKTLHSSWVDKAAGNKQKGDQPYKPVVLDLLSREEDVESAFLALEIAKREKHSGFPGESEISKTYYAHTPYFEHAKAARAFIYAFLHEEVKAGEKAGHEDQIGEACYFLYDLNHNNEEAGQRALDCKNRKMLFTVMKAAIHHQDAFSFGYKRWDAESYIEKLEKAGDPDGAKLRSILNEQLRVEEENRYYEAKEREEERKREEMKAYLRRQKLEEQADEVERDLNFWLHGEYSTELERALEGKMSYTDYAYSEAIRNKILDKKDEQD